MQLLSVLQTQTGFCGPRKGPDHCICHAAKQERLRQAKAEAEKEIAAYRAEREGAYQKKVAEVGSRTA